MLGGLINAGISAFTGGGVSLGDAGNAGVESGVANFQQQADNAVALNEAARESYSVAQGQQRATDTHNAAEDQATNNNKRLSNIISQNSRG